MLPSSDLFIRMDTSLPGKQLATSACSLFRMTASRNGNKASPGTLTPEGVGSMPQSDAAMREIAKVVRRHVDQETIEKIVDELFEIRSDKSFRDTIEKLAQALKTTF